METEAERVKMPRVRFFSKSVTRVRNKVCGLPILCSLS